jgi:UDP-2,3-diacylglucosamine hydrolase
VAEAVPQTAELMAPPHWRMVDFISDLHLHAAEPATFAAWKHYMESSRADALFILGDLFEVWVGDDVVGGDVFSGAPAARGTGFEDRCVQALRQAALRLDIFFMHGNRDFLIGDRLLGLSNMSLLADPTVLVFPASSGMPARRWLLSHGDALCVDDVDYIKFREQVRSQAWQSAFLARPLAERQAVARELRRQSDAKKQAGFAYADVDATAARQWLEAADASTLIHGHTHSPAVHDLGGRGGLKRVVLSDWDAQATPARAEVLRLTEAGLERITL